MTLKTIINRVRGRLGLAKFDTIIGNLDPGAVQNLELLQDVGDFVAERNFWQPLDIPGTITGDGTTTIFPLPSSGAGNAFNAGFDGGFGGGDATPNFAGMSPGLIFQSTANPLIPLVGPVTNEEMNALKAYPTVPIQPAWRIIENYFEFFPAPRAGEVLTYNYYSSNWIRTGPVAPGGAAVPAWVSEFVSDDDVPFLDEKLLSTGLEWRWLAAKGLDYAEAFRRFEKRMDLADGRQDSRREIATSRRYFDSDTIWPGNIPVIIPQGNP